MILSLKALAEDFVRVVNASIVDRRYYQDFYYLGNVYRVRIKFLRHDPKFTQRLPMPHRKQIPQVLSSPEVGVCVTCKGPSVGPVCVLRSCAIVIESQKQ